MIYEIKRSQEEIDAVMNNACEWEDHGGSSAPGLSYESGVKAMFEWLTADDGGDPPIESSPE